MEFEAAPVRVRVRSFSRSLPMALLIAREAVMNRFRALLHAFDITEQQWRVLRALASSDEVEVTVLAGVTCLLPASLSRILRDIDSRGLIARRTVPDDRRRTLISITADGQALIDAVTPYTDAAYAEIVENLGKSRMDALQRLLKELAETLDALPTPMTPHPDGLDEATRSD
ncbi:MAG: homoprotocatechuate degradation operon regulator HpaR [Salaquimonas sp.]|nr:homoprotocatechuate degradation operon regulator HpaR [Salaquimonas sp.]